MSIILRVYGQDAAYQAGLNMSSSLDVRNIDPNQVPGQTSVHNENIEDYINEKMQQRFSVHPDTDPLFINAEKAVADPHKTMEHVVMENAPSSGGDELVKCEQGGDEYVQRCEKHLEVDIEIIPEITRTESYCPGHVERTFNYRDSYMRDSRWFIYRFDYGYFNGPPRLVDCGREEYSTGPNTNYCNPGCCSRVIFHQPKSIKVTREEWIDGCQTLESLADQGLCQYVEAEIGPKETRTIQGEPIERDKWYEKCTYRCLKASANNCAQLGAKGCVQVASRCKERIGNVCVLYEQTYRCSKGKRKGSSYKATGNATPFCLTGDCTNDQYDDNKELFEVLSQLTVLQQVEKDIGANLQIFGGQVRDCSKHTIGFSDCCTTGGWGQSLGLAACSNSEKELAEWRPQRRCVLVGTYCAKREKLTNICIRKKTSFCCFGNKLSRLIQEQGRAQLGIGWGDPKSPNCQGLTPEQLSKLDFSRMDLSELFEDVARNFKPPSGEHMAKGGELDRIRANMNQMVKNIQIPKGRMPS